MSKLIRSLVVCLALMIGVAHAELEVHFLDVGQGDAALIMCDGEAMLIDGGPAVASHLIATAVTACCPGISSLSEPELSMHVQPTPALTERRGNAMLFLPTAMGIRVCSGSPPAIHFSISLATCQGNR